MGPSTPCPSCGRDCSAEHTFCGGCGTQVRELGYGTTVVRGVVVDPALDLCGSCNAPMDDSMSFCTACGAPSRATETGSLRAPGDDLKRRLEDATKGDYQILSPLGRGGMGSVFLAVDLTLHRHVAIKVMAPTLVQDPTMQERFRTEARIVATLRHPGIVNIHGLRVVNDLYFFVMDYVEGATLRTIIRAHGPLSIDVVQAIMYDVGSALQHAHSRAGGVIHRDVKPSNVILESRGHAVVMDFGISKAANTRSGLTMTGTVVGTPEYMSPEQCRGGEITPASDQYSLGLLGYAMLTGAPPFTGQHWSVLAQQTAADPLPVREVRPDCPPQVAEAIERMLRKAAKDRFPDVLTAVKALGGRPFEDGAPVRGIIGELVDRATEGRRAQTPVVTVTIEGVPEQASPGDVVSVSVTPLDGVGRALSDRRFTLESTNPSVLEVVGVESVRAVGAGAAAIIARCEGAEVTWPLVVSPPRVGSIAIDPLDHAVQVGDRLRLQALVFDHRGMELSDRTIVWGSSDAAVAQVTRAGELLARGAGSATVFATTEGQTTTLELEILPAKPIARAEPARTPTPREAAPPEIAPREVRPRDVPPRPDYDARPAAGRRTRAIVGVSGLLTVSGVWGITFLMAPDEPGSADAAPPAAVAAAVLLSQGGQPAPEEVELLTGRTIDFDAQPLDAEGGTLDAVVEWSSSDPSVASVDEQGRLVAMASGSAVITALTDGASRTLTVRVTEPQPATTRAAGAPAPSSPPIDITPGPVVSALTLSRADGGEPPAGGMRLEQGTTVALRAVATDPSGAPLGATPITWASTNPGVASVSADGTLRAVAAGAARISARAGGVTRDFLVEVAAPAPGTLALTVRPWAYVSIDGVRHGEDQRRLEITLPPGAHALRLENPAMTPFDTTVVISSGETTTVDKLLTSGGG